MRKKTVLVALLSAVALFTSACGASTAFQERAIDAMGGSVSSSAAISSSRSATAEYDDYGGEAGVAADTYDQTADMNGEAAMQEELSGVKATAGAAASTAQQRKVIQSASFSLETLTYEETLEAVRQKAEQTGSYIQASNSSGMVESGRAHTWMTLRIPADRYEEFKAFIREAGNVVSSSEGGEDVTAKYFDRDTRVTVLKTQETRLLELLKKANTVEDMLQIEDELTQVRMEIEQLTTELRRYDDLISYATIDLDITQTASVTPIANPDEKTFLSKIGDTAIQSMNAVADVLQMLVLALIWVAPYLIIALVVVMIVRLILRKNRKTVARKQQKASWQPAPPDFQGEPSGMTEAQPKESNENSDSSKPDGTSGQA